MARHGISSLVILQFVVAFLGQVSRSMRINSNSVEVVNRVDRGFPSEGDWENPETSQVVFQEIGRCYDPDLDWSDIAAHDGIPWEAQFKEAVSQSRKLDSDMPHGQILHRPLTSVVKKIGSMAKLLPYHQAVGLTSDRLQSVPSGQIWADSHCFAFDYLKEETPEKGQEGADDPHGCRFFRKTFQPLQQLRQCIIGKLGESPAWKAYEELARAVVARRAEGSRHVDNPLEKEESEQLDGEMLNESSIVKYTFDGIRRADEMIKYVSYHDWSTMDDGIIEEVERKLSETVITADKHAILGVDIIQAIRKDCFMVNADGWEGLPPKAQSLKRSLPCYQLMWDQVEVSGGREKPLSNAIGMWDPSLRYSSQVQLDIGVPPVCSRAAVALIAEKTKRAPQRFSSSSCLKKGEKSWGKCLHPRHFNCICFAHCYKRALEKMCEFESGCCPVSRL